MCVFLLLTFEEQTSERRAEQAWKSDLRPLVDQQFGVCGQAKKRSVHLRDFSHLISTVSPDVLSILLLELYPKK